MLVSVFFPAPDVKFGAAGVGTLDWVKPAIRHEQRESGFYLLTLILGGVSGYVGASRWFGGRQVRPLPLILLVALVPASTLAIGAAMPASRLLATLYSVAAIVALAAAVWLLRRTDKPADDALPGPKDTPAPSSSIRPIVSPLAAAAFALAVMAIFVVPLGAKGIASTIGFDMHMASFMMGPATYSFGDRLLPGIDYFTQYSVGTPWLFSFFLAPTASESMVNAVWFIIAEILFFQLTLLCFLRWFLRSWGWALVVALACLILQFTTQSPLYAPSSTSARHPLLILSIAAFAYWVRRDYGWAEALLLAVPLSGSLFLNTETGIYTCAAVAIVAPVLGPGLIVPVTRTLLLGAMTFVLFMTWNVIAFGFGVLQVQYLVLLLEPLMIYAGGMGAWPIEWIGGYHWLYNIVSPGLSLATIGWVASTARQPDHPIGRAELGALAAISLVGLFLTAKFINMSIVGLWQVNSLCLVIVMAWWARALVDVLPERWRPASAGTRRPPRFAPAFSPRALSSLSLAVLLVLFLGTITDARNPSLYGITAYRTHPTLVNLVFGVDSYPCPPERTGCASTPISPQDVALIDSLSAPKERVALLLMQDWAVLLEARRASKFHFLPSVVVFTQRQLDASLQQLDLVFLPREPADKLGIAHPAMEAILGPMLKRDFKVVGETPTLLAWRRTKSGE